MKKSNEFFRGCLLGGAIGDALGAPVEFMNFDQIIHQYGPKGIQDLQVSSSGKAQITDDTQMTLFTAEGILRAQSRNIEKGICHAPTVVFHAYQRWLLTQGYPRNPEDEWFYDGWLLSVKELYARRAPGNTCLAAISGRKQGTVIGPINYSKGCGGVMRVAPVGLFCEVKNAFDMASDVAALTHGHPSGYLSAGTFSLIIALIINGHELEHAIFKAMQILKEHEQSEECYDCLHRTVELAYSGLPDPEAIARIGEGWVGEEALAISVYCVIKYQNDFKRALIAAVNHSGDSDSTGAITGNILGAYLGITRIPADWIEKVELGDVALQIADDLLNGFEHTDEWWMRYPGY